MGRLETQVVDWGLGVGYAGKEKGIVFLDLEFLPLASIVVACSFMFPLCFCVLTNASIAHFIGRRNVVCAAAKGVRKGLSLDPLSVTPYIAGRVGPLCGEVR